MPGMRVREPVWVGAATYREYVAVERGQVTGGAGAYTGPKPLARSADAGMRGRPSDADLLARMALLAEQLDLALSELALCRAKYRQACDDDGADAPWLHSELDRLSLPRVARALSAELAALERVRLWAQELDGLHDQARTRSLLT